MPSASARSPKFRPVVKESYFTLPLAGGSDAVAAGEGFSQRKHEMSLKHAVPSPGLRARLSRRALVSAQYAAREEPLALILTLLAAEQRQHIAWGATSRATASVRETPGKQNNHESSTCVGLAA